MTGEFLDFLNLIFYIYVYIILYRYQIDFNVENHFTIHEMPQIVIKRDFVEDFDFFVKYLGFDDYNALNILV